MINFMMFFILFLTFFINFITFFIIIIFNFKILNFFYFSNFSNSFGLVGFFLNDLKIFFKLLV